jgi:NAD(P)-dependent dehydrogenase (short-subunit alcohol dehydrogenase family)
MQNSTKSVVITGASTGIGRACAFQLIRFGWQVFAGVRNFHHAEALHKDSTGQITPLIIDVTNEQTIAVAAWQVKQRVGVAGLQGLVNNAGIAIGGPLEFLDLARLRRQLEVNVVGQIAVSKGFLALLRQGQGRIVNMSSVSGRLAMPFIGPYSASKFALEALTDALRGELRPWKIPVISVQPGVIDTPIWEKSVSLSSAIFAEIPPQGHILYDRYLERLIRNVKDTGRRSIPPEKVAQVVTHILTTKRPKTRYQVGADARLGVALARWLPDGLRQWLLFKYWERL